MCEPISEIIDENGIHPIIVQFQNSKLQEGKEEKLQTAVFKKSKSKIIAVATKDILYTGTVKDDQETPNNKFLLICNKRTGQTRLVPVDVAILAPHFEQNPKTDVVDNPTSSKFSAVSDLNKQFGSKRIKRITEQRERLKMNIEDVKEQLEQTVQNVEIKDSESFIVQSTENDSLYRPPINREASTVEQVYPLNAIVPPKILSSLEDEANQVLAANTEQAQNINPFIKECLTNLQNSSNSHNLEKCELFLYIHYLATFVITPVKNITKKFVLCQSSKDVNDHILENFSVISNTGRTRPLSMKDKAVCYILVLAMIALDYHLDIEGLSKGLKTGVKKLQEMGRILAFSPDGKNKMVLKLPLPSAVSVNSPKKRRK